MTTQGARGEVTFKAGDREVTVLFTNRALVAAEKRLNKGVVGVAQGLINGDTGMAEVIVLLQVGMEAHRADAKLGGNQISESQAFSVMDQAGFGETAKAVMEAVAAVLGYQAENAAPEDGNGTGPNG